MSRLVRTMVVLSALCASVVVLAACGGGGSSAPVDVPALVGTEIPTAVLPTPTPPVCAPPAQLQLPASFPAEIKSAVPADFVVWSVQTSPNLIVTGRTYTQNPESKNEPLFGIAAVNIRDALLAAGWTAKININVSATDYTATAPDGRVLHFVTILHQDCPGQVEVVFDLTWLKG